MQDYNNLLELGMPNNPFDDLIPSSQGDRVAPYGISSLVTGNIPSQNPNQPSQAESFGRGALDSISFGFLPKAGGALGALGARLLRPDLFENQSYGETYQQGRDYLREQNAVAQEANPWSYGAGELTGGFVNPVVRGVNTVKGAIGAGAGLGALYGLGSSDQGEVGKLGLPNLYDVAVSGLFGGTLGGVAQGAVNTLLPSAVKAVNAYKGLPRETREGGFAGNTTPPPGSSPSTPQTPLSPSENALALSKQFNVPISQGQATQNLTQQTLEDLINSGAKGSEAATISMAQREAQQQAFQQAAQKLRSDIGGGQFIEKGQSLLPAAKKIMSSADADNKAVKEAYDVAKDAVGYLDIKDVKQFNNVAKAKLLDEALTPQNAPGTYSQLNAFNTIFGKGGKTAPSEVDFKKIEAYRQGLNRANNGAQGQDKYGIGLLKNQLDEFLDNTIETALVKGDSGVLSQFKDARSLAAKYKQNYTTKDKTAFGKKFVQDIVEHGDNYTPAMLGDKIFGANKYGFKPQSVSIINELKNRLGEASPEFQGIKLDAVQKVIKPLLNSKGKVNYNNVYVQTFKNNLYENEAVLKNILSPQEFKQLSDFGDLGSVLFQSRKSITNPPQSGLISAISKFPLIKQALGVASSITKVPGIKEIPGAIAEAQAKSAFNPVKVEAAVKAQNLPQMTIPSSRFAPASALAGTANVMTPTPTPQQTQPRNNSQVTNVQAQTKQNIPQTPSNPFLDLLSPQTQQPAIPAPTQPAQPQAAPAPEKVSQVNPELLDKIAQIESNNNPNATAKGSTASGTFQFTNSTWKDAINKYGQETGITLRDKNNPKAQRTIAELMLKDNAEGLTSFLGRDPKPAEIYLTHFLGNGGARKLLKSHPQQFAAQVLPEAAKANRSVFFKNGKPVTVAELYQTFNNKISKTNG